MVSASDVVTKYVSNQRTLELFGNAKSSELVSTVSFKVSEASEEPWIGAGLGQTLLQSSLSIRSKGLNFREGGFQLHQGGHKVKVVRKLFPSVDQDWTHDDGVLTSALIDNKPVLESYYRDIERSEIKCWIY